MRFEKHLSKLITYLSCLGVITISLAVMLFFFHCPIGWKAWIWLGIASVSLLLFWPLKRYTRLVPLLSALLVTVSFLCCSYVEPYFLKEADVTQGSPSAKENVWIAVWVLLAIGLCYLMAHVVTHMMDHLSPNEAVFGFGDHEAPKAPPSHRATVILSVILAVVILGFGTLSGVTYTKNTADVSTSAPYSEGDYTVVMPNLKGSLDEDIPVSVVHYGRDADVTYAALAHIPQNEFISATHHQGDSTTSLILRHKDHHRDIAKELSVLSMSYTISRPLYSTPPEALPSEDIPLVTAILQEDPSAVPVELKNATHYGYVTVRFMGQEHLRWEAELLKQGDTFYIRVATGKDFSEKDKGYEPLYRCYALTQSYH